MFDSFLTSDNLTTFTGLVGAVMLIVQFTKTIVKNKFGEPFVRLYSFVIALILTFVFAPGGNELKDIVLMIINAILITIASTGGYEMLVDPLAKKTKAKK